MDCGRTEEAIELLRFISSWDDDDDITMVPVVSGNTVIARNPLLPEPSPRPEPPPRPEPSAETRRS